MAHHPLGPSSSSRWIPCPGSVRLTRGMSDPGSPFAQEGTVAHELAEFCLRRGINMDDPVVDSAAKAICPDEMREYVQVYLDYVRSLPGDLYIEEKVELSPWIPGGFGTADAISVNDGVCYVTDLKYGKGVKVYAKANPQGMIYCLGAYNAFAYMHLIRSFRFTIVQPRLDHIDYWDIDVADLLHWADTVLKPAADAALTPDAPLVAGEKQCRFCLARNTCRVRADYVFKTAYEDFGPLPSSDHLSVEEIAELLPKLGSIEDWISDLRGHALKTAVDDGAEYPGYKLVEGRSIRQWIREAPQRLLEAGLSEDQIYNRSLVGLGQIEKILGGAKKASPVLAQCTVKPSGKPTLVPDEDPRPALQAKTSAAEDFAVQR